MTRVWTVILATALFGACGSAPSSSSRQQASGGDCNAPIVGGVDRRCPPLPMVCIQCLDQCDRSSDCGPGQICCPSQGGCGNQCAAPSS